MHLFSVYKIGIPLFLENKSYPGIPTPRKRKSVTIPTITSGSGQKVKPLGANIGGQNPFSTSLHPPPILTLLFLENESYPGIHTYLVPSLGDHSIL